MPNPAILSHSSLQWRVDSFLAEILHYPVYRLVFDDDIRLGDGDEWPEIQKIATREGAFLYAKTDVTHLLQAHALEAQGFRLVDTNVVLAKPFLAGQARTAAPLIRPATFADEEAVARIARTSFHWTRFHRDEYFPAGTGERVKEAWVRNYFRGRRGDFLLVAESRDTIAGFILLSRRRPEELTIDLIAVDLRFRRQGIAGALIATVENVMTGFETMIAGTQLANLPALRLYEKSGFRVAEAYYVWHYHGQRQPERQERLQVRSRTADRYIPLGTEEI